MATTFNKHVHNVIYNATWRCFLRHRMCHREFQTLHTSGLNSLKKAQIANHLSRSEFQTLHTSGLNSLKKAQIANHLSHKLYARLLWVIDQCNKHSITIPPGTAEIIAAKPRVGAKQTAVF